MLPIRCASTLRLPRPMSTRLSFVLISAILGLALPRANANAQTSTISGRVSDQTTKIGLERARVSALLGQVVARTTETDAEGRYSLKDLAAGRYTVTVARIGQQLRQSNSFDLAAGATLTMDFETSPTAARL